MASSVKSITELLDDLREGRETDPVKPKPVTEGDPELVGLDEDDKVRRVMEARHRGVPVGALAKMYAVDPSTIWRWAQKARQQARQRMEQEFGADLIMDSVMLYEELERVCLYEVNVLEKGEAKIGKDGKITRDTNVHEKGLRQKWLGMAVKIRQARDQLLTNCGVLPKEPDRIYHTMSEERRVDDKEEDADKRVPTEEMKNRIRRLLQEGRSIE